MRGGTDQGPTPIETMLAALLGCTNVILNRVAEKHDLTIKDLSLLAEASFDRRGVMLQEEVAVPFPEIRDDQSDDAGERRPGRAPQARRRMGRTVIR